MVKPLVSIWKVLGLTLSTTKIQKFKIYVFCFNVRVLCLHVHLHARRGHQVPLEMVVSHQVVAGIELRTSTRAVTALDHLWSPNWSVFQAGSHLSLAGLTPCSWDWSWTCWGKICIPALCVYIKSLCSREPGNHNSLDWPQSQGNPAPLSSTVRVTDVRSHIWLMLLIYYKMVWGWRGG